MYLSTIRIQIMHALSFAVLLIPLLVLIVKSQESALYCVIPIGFVAGIGIGILFYRFYLRKLKGDIIILKGNAFPHLQILGIVFFLSLPVIGAFLVLAEFGILQENILQIILNKAILISAILLLSCFLSSIIAELVLLFLWERKHNIKLFVDLRDAPGF